MKVFVILALIGHERWPKVVAVAATKALAEEIAAVSREEWDTQIFEATLVTK